MSGKQLLGILFGIVALWAFVHWARDPHRTALPFGTTDLSSVEKELQRLPAEDRALVESYVKRSNGDVLLPSMADPENPLTARRFDEAIALEKRWNAKMAEQQAAAAVRAAERDRVLEPLRELVEAKVVRREILPASQLYAAPGTNPDAPKKALSNNDHEVFVVTIAIYNHSASDLVELKGSLQAKDSNNYLPLDLCWIDVNEHNPVPALGRSDIRCGNSNRGADANERAFIDDPPGRFTVVWEPRKMRFADGKTLDSKL